MISYLVSKFAKGELSNLVKECFGNDFPEYGLNFISDDMRNRIIDNFDSCVYGTVFID